MEPEHFDGAAGAALLVLMPASVLFVAAAMRQLRVPRWAWVVFLAAAVVALVQLDAAGRVRYPGPADAAFPGWDFEQFVGLGVGRVGVAVNAGAAALHGLLTHRRRRLVRPAGATVLEARITVVGYLATAVGAALPAAWWCAGSGLPPLGAVVVPVAFGAAALGVVVLLRVRRERDDPEQRVDTVFPADAVAAVALTGMLAVGVLLGGTGLPDPTLVPDDRARPVVTTPGPDPADWPASYGPRPATTTTLPAADVESGTRALLEETVRWAGPLDDLSSPTPAAAPAPAVQVDRVACDDGRLRWTGSVVLPSIRPQDVAERVLAGWSDAGYTAADRAMGTDTRWPVGPDAAVERMELSGDAAGVHVDVESFCAP